MLKAQYATVQSVNHQYHKKLKLLSGSPVEFSIGPGTPGWIAVLPFTNEVLNDLGGQRPFDGIALHPYRFPPATDGPSTAVCDYAGGVPVTKGYATSDCPSPNWPWLTWPQELSAYEQEFGDHGYGQQPL